MFCEIVIKSRIVSAVNVATIEDMGNDSYLITAVNGRRLWAKSKKNLAYEFANDICENNHIAVLDCDEFYPDLWGR